MLRSKGMYLGLVIIITWPMSGRGFELATSQSVAWLKTSKQTNQQSRTKQNKQKLIALRPRRLLVFMRQGVGLKFHHPLNLSPILK